jgi:hypothetical protein
MFSSSTEKIKETHYNTLGIPETATPEEIKKEQEKEINEFEIMKGQIMSGNDNVELIKKFKILLMKLSKKDVIPSREAKDILFELTSMGY